MKLIAIHSNPDAYELIADSAITLSGRPWFIPELEGGCSWQLIPMTAIRISRLGKSISAKFASRYFDAITIGVRLMPLNAQGEPLSSVTSLIDFGIALGEWIKVEQDPTTLNIGNSVIELQPAIERATEEICKLSKFATLKIGDTLLLPTNIEPIQASVGLNVTANIDGKNVMTATLR